MSNQIQFQSFDFQSSAVRIITDPNQEFWFCANDVCAILDYANPRQAVQKNCKPKGVSIRDTLTSGGNQEMIYINEPNLYRLIIKSRKPEAEPFEAWVFEEVLPQIRKTGQYSQNSQPNLVLDIHLPRIKEMDTNFSQLLYYAKEARNVMWETDRMVTQLYEMLGIQLVGHTSLTTKIKLLKEMDFAVENSEEVMRKHRHSFRQY